MKYTISGRSDNAKRTDWKVLTVGSLEDILEEMFQQQGHGRDYVDEIRIEWVRPQEVAK